MKLLIENEGDMELGVKYATSLALKKEKNLLKNISGTMNLYSIMYILN